MSHKPPSDISAKRALRGVHLEPEVPTLREFSKRLLLPSGPMRGFHYDPDSDPCQSWLIDQMDSGRWDRIYVCAPPQIGGKTQVCVLTPTLRYVIAAELPVGYVLPTLQDLDKSWSEKLRPTIIGAGFEKYLPLKGPGSRQGRGPTITMRDPDTGKDVGRISFLTGGAYSTTVAVVIVDELDQFRNADGTPRWKDLEHCYHRADSYGTAAMRIGVGTIEDDEQCIVLTCTDEFGTGTRPWLQCPHCGRHQRVTWDLVRYDGSDEESVRSTARIFCLHCGAGWDEMDRQQALLGMVMAHKGQEVNERGKVTGPSPRTRSLGLVWMALESSLATLGEVAVEHWKAYRKAHPTDPAVEPNHALLRDFTRYRLCQTYHGDEDNREDEPETISRRGLAGKFATRGFADLEPADKDEFGSRYRAAEIPDGCTRAVLATDVQANRMYWSLIGFDDDRRTWDLAWGYEFGDPSQSAWAVDGMTACLERIEDHALMDGVDIVEKLLDTGYEAKELLKFLRQRKDWRGIRGVPSIPKGLSKRDGGGIIAWDRKWHPGVGRYDVITEQARHRVHAGYLSDPTSAGAAILPRGLRAGDAYLMHLCAEVWEAPKPDKAGRWVTKYKRNDHLDCRCYATAVILRILAQEEGRDGDQSERPKDAPPAAGSGWGGDWITGGGGSNVW